MARAYVSYSRRQKHIVKQLAEDLKTLDHGVWFDPELSGGQHWWDAILDQIKRRDIFVFAISRDSLESEACDSEWRWASALGRPILPVVIDASISPVDLPEDLAQLQLVHYREDDKKAFIDLRDAIAKLPAAGPVPDPPPPAPSPPGQFVNRIRDVIAKPDLSEDEQWSVLRRVKKHPWREEEIEAGIAALQTLKKNPLTARPVEDDIDSFIERLKKKHRPQKQPRRPAPSKPAEQPRPSAPATDETEEEDKEMSCSDFLAVVGLILLLLFMLRECQVI